METSYQTIDSYLKFMWNKFDKDTCINIFGDDIGNHIWGKYAYIMETHGSFGAPAVIMAELDKETASQLIEYALNAMAK